MILKVGLVPLASCQVVVLLLLLLALSVDALSQVDAAKDNVEIQQKQTTDDVDDELLRRVCSSSENKWRDWPVITSPAQVRALADKFELDRQVNGGSLCQSDYAEAFSALKELLKPPQEQQQPQPQPQQQQDDDNVLLEDICGAQMYERIREFHIMFMHFYVPELSRDELKELKGSKRKFFNEKLLPIPPPLRRFFIAFVKQISGACKHQAVARLNQLLAEGKLVDEDDFDVIKEYKAESRRLGAMYELKKLGLSRFGEDTETHFANLEVIDLIEAKARGAHADMLELGGGGGGGSGAGSGSGSGVPGEVDADYGTKLYVQVRFDHGLRRIKEACQKRFVPVYSELLLPVIRLNNLGYVDHTYTKAEDQELDNKNGELFRWLDVIQTCEVLKDVEILHDPRAYHAAVGIIQKDPQFVPEDQNDADAAIWPDTFGSSQAQPASSQLPASVKILSRAEASELQRKVGGFEEVSARSVYEPAQVRLDHVRLAFAPRLWLATDVKLCQRECDNFYRDLERTIDKKTSWLRALMSDVGFRVKNFFYRANNHIDDRDKSTALGRLVAFMDRHPYLMSTVAFLFPMVFMTTMMLAG